MQQAVYRSTNELALSMF